MSQARRKRSGSARRVVAAALMLVVCAGVPATGCARGQPVHGGTPEAHDSYAARYHAFAVAADHPVASAAGAEILARGGNAVDAAVAVSFCLSVVRPYSCGIGGGGFMLVHMPPREGRGAKTVALDYRERAPAAVGPDYFTRLDDALASRVGAHAMGVPGTVAGLLHAHAQWGRLDREVVLEPAIRAARDGYRLDDYAIEAMEEVRRMREEHPRLRSDLDELWRVFCDQGVQKAGDFHRNPDLAQTLEAIAKNGEKAFYEGEIAARMVAHVQERGGVLTLDDLASYRPVVRHPQTAVWSRPRAGEPLIVATMPPPSSGGIALLQMLGMLERLEVRFGQPEGSVSRLHRLVEVMQHAFADRAEFPADPDFVPVPVEMLLSDATLDRYAGAFDPEETLGSDAYGSGQSQRTADIGGGTSHFSIVDGDGMAVACTETVNLLFGSMMVVPGLGFPLNNEMDDFTTKPGSVNAFGLLQSDANLPAPGKRPLSSMTPTIVLDSDGHVRAVIGASGGPRIITGTLQVLYACFSDGDHPADAMIRPRVHHQWLPRRIDLEPELDVAGVTDGLRARGHTIGVRRDIGHVQAIFVWPDALHAVSDPRKGGRPAGR